MTWIHAVVDVPADEHASAAAFWEQALGWRLGEPWDGHPELRSFEPPSGTPYLHLQQVDGTHRVHIDIETGDPASAVERAVERGARHVAVHDRWQTLVSPGGLLFCVLRVGEHQAPEPVTWSGGHRSRMVQVCIDSPASAHDREVDFWRGLLLGRWSSSDAPEFAGKLHDDDGSPLQLLFQRLDESGGPVRAHLDHGTDNVPAEVGRLVRLGATALGPGREWHLMRDPVGQLFCVTPNSPAQTRTRDL
jgi:predicted enzyme related to lactoylglutathione lyase